MNAVYVDNDALHKWHGDWHSDLVDYAKPLDVIGVNAECDCDGSDCKYHEPIYSLIQHEIYPDGVIIECPVRFTIPA